MGERRRCKWCANGKAHAFTLDCDEARAIRDAADRHFDNLQEAKARIAALSAEVKELREELDACKTVIACPDCSLTICDEHTEQLQEGARSGGK